MSSFNASYGGQQAHAWAITFMSVSGDVGELVVNGTNITSGDVAVTERVKVSLSNDESSSPRNCSYYFLLSVLCRHPS